MTLVPRRFLKRRALVALLLMPWLIIGAVLLYLACDEETAQFDTAGAAGIAYTPLECIVPGPGLPQDVHPMGSNNNVDVARFGDRFYVAFRTAPTHFASPKTRLVVLSSEDRKTWKKETEIALQSDLREPRLLVFNDTLFLYFFRAGSNPLRFEPQSIYATQRGADGTWREPRPIFKPGYVVWRARVFGGTAYMSVYYGAGLYTTGDRPGDVRLLTSADGIAWEPISEATQVDRVSAEEGEFDFDAEGNLVATVRLETEGALVCTASKERLDVWQCTYTPYKYDSALMFQHAGTFYEIARRNVAGPFETESRWLPRGLHRAWRMARYSLTRKRTTLYRVDRDARRLVPLFDFPSKGDTAFAGIAPLDARTYYVVNYSSPIDGLDWPWLGGQLAGSHLYATELAFPAS